MLVRLPGSLLERERGGFAYLHDFLVGSRTGEVGEGARAMRDVMVMESFHSFTCKTRGRYMGGTARVGLGVMV